MDSVKLTDEGDNYKVRDLSLAAEGRRQIEWAESRMPVLMKLREMFKKTQPLKGEIIAGCLHVTKETAVLIETLMAAGAEIAWSGCNPLSTNDAVTAALAEAGAPIWAWHGMNTDEFYWAIDKTIERKPTLTLDDGADLIFTIHNKSPEAAKIVKGGTEETTTGVHRLRAMAKDGKLLYPIIAVNDAVTKCDFDNVYGTGQSTLDGIIRATSVLLSGKVFVIAGFGHCGRGLGARAQGMGSNVVVTEVDPIAGLRAAMEGFSVMKMDEAAKIGDIFVTATGMKDVIVKRHFESMKEGAIVANTGHYDVEINIPELEAMASSVREIRENTQEFTMPDGRRIFLLAKGRLVNLAAAEGHPSEVMDMSFANQALALIELKAKAGQLENTVYDVSEAQDQRVAALKLELMGMDIDSLTEEQIKYRDSYAEGT